MQLTIAELARLEHMVAAGRVRSDPPTLSATDRMMDTMLRAANKKDNVQTLPESVPAPRTDSAQGADRGRDTIPRDSTVADELQLDWNAPRSLEELVQIRRALMRSVEPDLGAC